jgi:O-antigen ligase
MLSLMFSYVGTLNAATTTRELIKFIFIFALYFAILDGCDNEKVVFEIPVIITVVASILSVLMIVGYINHSVVPDDRTWHRLIFSSYRQLNGTGMFLAFSIPFTVYAYSVAKKQLHLLLCDGAILVQYIALLITFSRSSWITVAVIVVILLGLKGIYYKPLQRMMIVLALALTAALLFINPVKIYNRALSTIDKNDGSAYSRKEQMTAALQLAKQSPLFGVGLGNFQVAAKKKLSLNVTPMAHNIFLNYAAEAGWPAAVTLMILMLAYLYHSVRIYRHLSDEKMKTLVLVAVVTFCGMIVNAQFGDVFIRSIKEYFVVLLVLPFAVKRLVVNKEYHK